MNNFKWIVKQRWLLRKKHPLSLIIGVVLPLLSMIFYLQAYQQSSDMMTVAVVDPAPSVYTNFFKQRLASSVKIETFPNQAAADSAAINNEVSAVVVINPQAAHRLAEHRSGVIASVSSLQGKFTLKSFKNNVQLAANLTQQLALQAKSLTEFKKLTNHYQRALPKLSFRDTGDAEQSQMMSVQIIGVVLMLALYYASSLSSEIMQKERSDGTFQRLMLSPVSRRTYLSATVCFAFGLLSIQSGTTLLIMRWIFKINPGCSYLALWLLLELFDLLAIAVALLIGSWSTNRKMDGALQTIIYTVTSLLSGGFIPLIVMPKIMQRIAALTPQYWVIKIISQLQHQTGWQSISFSLMILIAFILVFLAGTVYKLSNSRTIARFA